MINVSPGDIAADLFRALQPTEPSLRLCDEAANAALNPSTDSP